jgi:hypothetical protein
MYLTDLFSSQDRKNWAVDVRGAPYKIIAISVADDLVPGYFPLKYFDPWYVRLALLLRAERKIIDQTKAEYGVDLLGPDKESEISKLNEICRKRNILTGLGDLDLLSHCSVNSQYQHQLGGVFIGQTFDGNLREALAVRQRLVKSNHVMFGQPDTEAQLAQFTETMLYGFRDEQARVAHLQPSIQAFLHAVLGTFDRLFPSV